MPLSLDPDRKRPPKHLGRHFGLFDGPAYRDWLAWWTVFWLVVAGLSTAFPTVDATRTTSLPRWLDVLLAALVFALLFGVVPAYGRLLFRRHRIKRARRRAAVPPPSPAPSKAASTDAFASADCNTPVVRRHDPPQPTPSPPASPPSPSPPREVSQPAPVRRALVGTLDVSTFSSNEHLTEASRVLPYPVARAARRLQLASDAKEAYEAALRTSEVLMTVLGISAAAWAQQRGIRTDALDRLVVDLKGRGVAQGTWLTAAQSIEKPMLESNDGLPGMLAALRTRKREPGLVAELDSAVRERNAWAHGAAPQSKAEAGERLAELFPPLERALVLSMPLAQHEWLFVESAEFQRREQAFLLTGLRAMGAHPDWDRTTLSSSVPVVNQSFYLQAPWGLIDLTPFVVLRHCPTCRQSEVAYADRVDPKKGVSLKTFDRAHAMFDDSLVDDVNSLLAIKGPETGSTAS
jgi:hypothetical protein